MTAFSNQLENALLDVTLRAAAYSPTTASVYAALHTSAPTDADTGVEVSGPAYARQVVTFSAPVSGACSNSAQVQFPAATGSWGTVTHFGLYDDVSGGNLLYWGALATSKVVDNGDVFTFPAGNITVTLD